MRSGHVRRDGTQIYWEAHGEGDPVLYLHAGVADSRMWRHQHHLDGYSAICFDQRGFGRTEWKPGHYFEWEDAVAVLDELEIPKAIVTGCSLGGSIALHLALAAPDRVSGLVLSGASAGGWEPEGGWSDDPLWDEAVAAGEAGDLDRIVEIDTQMWLVGYGRAQADIDNELIALFQEMDRIAVPTEQERSEQVGRFGSTADRLGEIDLPTLVIIGEYDAHDLHKSARFLAESLSEIPVATIDDAAHLPSLEQPSAFNGVVRDFLTSL